MQSRYHRTFLCGGVVLAVLTCSRGCTRLVSQERTSIFNCLEFCCIADAVSPNLTISDLGEVVKEVCKAKDRWKFIGLELGVSKPDLDGIENDYSKVKERLLEALAKWLQSGKNTTWNALAEAVGSDMVDREDIKDKILANHF